MFKQFKNTLKHAKLPDVPFHSLRKSAGSIMLAHGAQLIDVSHILGHRDVGVTARIYAHSFDEGQRSAIVAASRVILTKRSA